MPIVSRESAIWMFYKVRLNAICEDVSSESAIFEDQFCVHTVFDPPPNKTTLKATGLTAGAIMDIKTLEDVSSGSAIH